MRHPCSVHKVQTAVAVVPLSWFSLDLPAICEAASHLHTSALSLLVIRPSVTAPLHVYQGFRGLWVQR